MSAHHLAPNSTSPKFYADLSRIGISTLENLTKKLLEVAKAVNFSGDISYLEERVSDNIDFISVKAYKMLRNKSEEPLSSPEVVRKLAAESLLLKQVSELKRYLAILIAKNELALPVDRGSRTRSQQSELAKWLGDKEFKQKTKEVVIQFQKQHDICADGVVGPQTYETLKTYVDRNFSRPETEPPLRKTFGMIFESSLVTDDVFNGMLEEVKPDIIAQIEAELKAEQTLGIRTSDIVFERSFLTEIQSLVEESNDDFPGIFEDLFKNSGESSSNISQKIEDFIKESKFKEIFNREFYILDPIMSVTIKFVSPIAATKNELLEKILLRGFSNFKDNLEQQTKPSVEHSVSADKKLEVYSFDQLARSAIYEALYSLSLAIKLLLARKSRAEEVKDFDETLKFYFIVKKFLNCLYLRGNQEYQRLPKNQPQKKAECLKKFQLFQVKTFSKKGLGSDTTKIQMVNIFNKQEFLEFEPPPINHAHKPEDEDELFSTVQLKLPVKQRYLQERNISHDSKAQKDYLYLPGVVDLSYWCSEIADQEPLQACNAFAGVALIEYFANRNFGKHINLSPLFLYKAARNLMNLYADLGSSIRETMKAMALFGVPPEESWPYDPKRVDEDPPPSCYSYAQNYQALKYFRLDYAGVPKDQLLLQIKVMLASGFLCMFGFTIYSSAYQESNLKEGLIPFPNVPVDRLAGGHGVVAVGYDDYKVIRCADLNTYSTGALLIRNSWGTDWGKNGYGWLPYDYVLTGLTGAWWSVLKSEWFDTDTFGAGGGGGQSYGRGW